MSAILSPLVASARRGRRALPLCIVHPEFWHERWRTGRVGFHQTAVEGALKQHWQDLSLAPGARVFVPLCGKSLDLLWLRDHGHPVVGIELSDIALQEFCMENGIPARRRAAWPGALQRVTAAPPLNAPAVFSAAPSFETYEAPGLTLLCGDFFALEAPQFSTTAAVYDRAALIAWPREQREAYVAHLATLTAASTRTLLIVLEYPQAQMPGPPFSVESAEVRRLFSAQYLIDELSRTDILASEPRLRDRGVTSLQHVCYRLTRL